MNIRRIIGPFVLAWLTVCACTAKQHITASDSVLLQRIYAYAEPLRKDLEGQQMNVYSRFMINTLKKNRLLIMVPTMHAISRGKHPRYVGESYSRFTFEDIKTTRRRGQVEVSTLSRNRQAMPMLSEFSTPALYEVTLMNDHLLSPFHRRNVQFYRYGFRRTGTGMVELTFVPRNGNTQVVKGKALVEEATGRIHNVYFEGEYDMISFHVFAEMGQSGFRSLIPANCDIGGTFHCAGNRIAANFHIEFDLPRTLPDSIIDNHDRALMDSLRPSPLPDEYLQVYQRQDSIDQSRAGTVKKRKRNPWKYIFWDLIGDNLVNRIKGNFGSQDQGSFRISPILNPLYLGYTGRKGFTYKFKLRGHYRFSEQQELAAQLRGGYSFKQKQFYFRLPVTYTFDMKHQGYVTAEVGNGNRITNSSVKDYIIDEHHDDSAHYEKLNLDYFRDMYFKLHGGYDVNDYWSFGAGLTYHRRSAVDKTGFEETGRPTTYHSLAPMVEATLRPWGWEGPVFVVNYEQGIKGIGNCNTQYGRIEADAIWLRRFYRLRSLSMRWGGGLYTMKDRENYFLDFENFRDENLPGGWNDDWTGEFQLLNRDTYNSSDFYLRFNLTYESPLMLLSRTPFLGRYVEMERIYASALVVDGIYPYTEMGYGFTNRLFSIGLFVATRNAKYDGIGCRIGLELFRDW